MTTIDKLRSEPIFAENEDYILRNLKDSDREEYIHTLKGVSSIPQIYEIYRIQQFNKCNKCNKILYHSIVLLV